MPAFDPVTSATRVLEVLRIINELRNATAIEVQRRSGLPKATVLRMIETLISAGYVARAADAPLYSATGRCLQLSQGYDRHADFAASATAPMEDLKRCIGWPSDFAIFDRDAMVIILSSSELGVLSLTGGGDARTPLLKSALGQAYLAHCAADEQQEILARLGESGQVPHLPKLLKQVRGRGYALGEPDYLDSLYPAGRWSIGVAVLVAGKPIAALNVVFHRAAMSQEQGIQNLLAPLQETAEAIAAASTSIIG